YQHYKPLTDILTGSSPVIWGVLVAQTALVGLGLAPWWAALRTWSKDNLRPWQVLLLGGVFFLSTTTVSEDVTFFLREWAFACCVQTVQLANVALIALSLPSAAVRPLQQYVDRFIGAPARNTVAQPGPPDRFACSLALWVVLLAALLNVLAYNRHPHVPDEVAYLTHAGFFANGALSMPAPAVPEAFDVYLMEVNGDRWYAVPPPGWPAMLAVGTLFDVPWLVNPMLAGVNLLLAYTLLRELYPMRTARLAVLLLAVSPWYVFLGMSFMTHMFALTCALLATLGVARARRTGNTAWTWGGGLALGAISMIRPLEAVAVAGLLGLWAIGVGGTRLRIAATSGLVAGALITGGLGLLYNRALTGQPLQFPINAYTDQLFGPNTNAYGFGPDRGMGWAFDPYPGHAPLDALINTNLNVSTLNTELFGWSIG
ncbi:MAG: ArnT family glycosyltransferase, partial [Vicinamibacterales bacterium]